jgi:electron transfer flavoprotein alpha subunit
LAERADTATGRPEQAGGEVWVFVELDEGRIADVSLELLGRARELAARLGVETGAVVAGAGASTLAPGLIAHGADVVYAADHELLSTYLAGPYARFVAGLVRRERPQIVLYGATTTGRDLAPRVASTLRTGLTADCTDLQIGDHGTREKQYRDLLYQIRPAFGGNIIATIVCPVHRPQMATVREGVMRMPEPDGTRTGRVEMVEIRVGSPGEDAATLSDAGTDRADHAGPEGVTVAAAADNQTPPPAPIVLEPGDLDVALLDRHKEEKKVDLKGARIIVAGGVGVGSREGFALIERLAETLGGVVGASRAAVDAGWVSHEHQVGQTGTTVRPKLYIAAGISGSVQHRAGMDESSRILVINTDPLAPIFSVAHYGIVGDLHDVIPRMIRAYKSKGAV